MNAGLLNQVQPVLLSSSHISESPEPVRNMSFGVRTVQSYELDYILWGEGFVITDGELLPATGGTLFFRTPGMVVEGIRPYHCYYITCQLFGPGVEVPPEDLFPRIMLFQDPSRIEAVFARLYQESLNRQEISPFLTRTLLMDILLLMYEEWVTRERFESLPTSLREHYPVIQSLAARIRENAHREDLDLEGMARLAGYSKFFFCRIFHEVMGSPPVHYVNQCRIRHAMQLLLETRLPVQEVMQQSGYDSSSHFYRTFRDQVGCSPTVYRQRNRLWAL